MSSSSSSSSRNAVSWDQSSEHIPSRRGVRKKGTGIDRDGREQRKKKRERKSYSRNIILGSSRAERIISSLVGIAFSIVTSSHSLGLPNVLGFRRLFVFEYLYFVHKSISNTSLFKSFIRRIESMNLHGNAIKSEESKFRKLFRNLKTFPN